MRFVGILVIAVTACGDNRQVAVDEGEHGCVVRGERIVLPRVAWGCQVEGAPPRPDCIDDVPTHVTAPRRDPRLFVVELHGKIRIIENGKLRPEPFLDLSEDAGGPVLSPGPLSESGLLGLAFHPNYAVNRQFFVFYTARNPDAQTGGAPYLNVLARFTTSSDPSRAMVESQAVLFAIPDLYSNHNGGMIEFGKDGYLYISTGDGGGHTEQANGRWNSQDHNSLLGKMLRIDVDHKDPGKEYGIPIDNPFTTGLREIYMLGLRNPWRWSFDPVTGDIWLGDVGEALWEELDVIPAGKQAGANLGWPMWEGNSCFRPPACDPTGLTFPVEAQDHSIGWWSIIPGQVYNGSCYPDLAGEFFYSDCGYQTLMRGRIDNNGAYRVKEVPQSFVRCPTSIYPDSRGELFITSLDGSVHQITVAPPEP